VGDVGDISDFHLTALARKTGTLTIFRIFRFLRKMASVPVFRSGTMLPPFRATSSGLHHFYMPGTNETGFGATAAIKPPTEIIGIFRNI